MGGIERRRYERHTPQNVVFAALSEAHSIISVGTIKNISKGGLLFEYIANGTPRVGMEARIDVFKSGATLKLNKVDCTIVHNSEVVPNHYTIGATVPMRKCGLQFETLTAEQQSLIENFFG